MSLSNPILDAPELPAPKPVGRFQKIIRTVEAALWVILLLVGISLFFFFQNIVADGFSQGLMVSLSIQLLIALMNLVFPIFIFGSRGWKQHLISHFCGGMFVLWGLSILFILESWYPGLEMRQTAAWGSLVAWLSALIFIVTKRPEGLTASFAWRIFWRMVLIFLMTVEELLNLFLG